ncbi:MAG: DUF2927 domain-containing protein [Pseudomonadota bacterium]
MMRWGALAAVCLLSACASVERIELPGNVTTIEKALPPANSFTTSRPTPPARSNTNIAADFLDLHFALESGTQLPVFTRFETPVTVRLTGKPTPSMQSDLARLLTRLRREAGIDIRQVSEGQANITIEAVSQRDIHRILPNAACFVVPNSSSLEEYRRDRRKAKSSWTELQQRERLGIFIPYDVSPQEMRDCLHEELAQALGPLNDLYHLPDSVFNDDNIHTVLTGFDMLILRTAYAPELKTGMTREQVEAALPGILSRLNPRGDRLPVQQVSATPASWQKAIQKSLRPGRAKVLRIRDARRAAKIAQQLGWTDHRNFYPYYLLGRMTQFDNPAEALRYYQIALQFLREAQATELHQAHLTAQLSAYALAEGKGPENLPHLDIAIDRMVQAENAAQLATLLLLKSEALLQEGRILEASAVRLDSIRWARYGFGTDVVVQSLVESRAARSAGNNIGG